MHNLTIIKTSNYFSRPKYKPRNVHNCYGVFDSKEKKTLIRNKTANECKKYIESLKQ